MCFSDLPAVSACGMSAEHQDFLPEIPDKSQLAGTGMLLLTLIASLKHIDLRMQLVAGNTTLQFDLPSS